MKTTNTTTSTRLTNSRWGIAAGVAALAGLTGFAGGYAAADSAPPQPQAPAVASARSVQSPDALERRGQAEHERLVELCRTSAGTPDSIEHCFVRHGG